MGQGNDFSQFYEGSGLVYADVPNEANDFGTAVTGGTFGFGIGNPASTIHSTSQVTTGEWIQVVAVRQVDPDAAVSYLRVYVNGVLEAEEIHSNVLPVDAPANISIGGNAIDRRFFRGMLDEVALFGVALEDEDVASAYNAYLGLTPCFAANPIEGFSPLLVDFDASCSHATAGAITSYYWEFGDGGTATGQKVSHTFAGVGAFTVKLTITSSEGHSASTTRVVTTRFRAGDVSPWISEDVGGPTAPGGARSDADCLVVYAHGRDIASRSDQFHFLHQALEGDGSLVARFTGFEPEALAAKAGLMMRAATAPDSAFVAAMLQNTAGTQVAFIRRIETGGLVRSNLLGVVTLPVWLKLERAGGEIVASKSEDGAAWTELGRETILAEGTIRAGIAATGRDSGTGAAVLATACDVRLAGGTPGGELFHRGDANGDGGLNITDGIFILNFLFLGGSPPPAPGPADSPCGPDPADSPSDLGCEIYEPC